MKTSRAKCSLRPFFTSGGVEEKNGHSQSSENGLPQGLQTNERKPRPHSLKIENGEKKRRDERRAGSYGVRGGDSRNRKEGGGRACSGGSAERTRRRCVKENLVQALADLKEDCSKWVVAESAGIVHQPSQLLGASVGLFMRFFSKKDLDEYLSSEQRIAMAEKFVMPYTTGDITLEYEAEVDDNDEAVFRRGDAFKNGAERIVFIKVKNDTNQEDIDTMVKSLNDLNDAPELSSLLIQITAGTNFCAWDQRYSHGLVVRCPSLEVLQEYSKHPYHIGVISKTVWPIAERLLQADYVVDGSGARRSLV